MRLLPGLILFFSLGLISCSKKTIPVASTPATIKSVDLEEIDFGYLHGKARLVYKDEKKEREVKAHIRVRKDSVIWMTFTVVGVQGGKALINKDSITIVSTVNREYYVFTYPELSKKFHIQVDYSVIEAAMLGNLVHKRQATDLINESGEFNMLTQSQGDVAIQNAINKQTKKIEKVAMKEPTTGNTLNVSYTNFQPLGEKSFAYNSAIDILFHSLNGPIRNSILVEYTKAEVGNKELRFPFSIPKKYDRR